MAWRQAVRIELNDEERSELQARIRRRKIARSDAMRAEIVLLAADGITNLGIAEKLRITRVTVATWRTRFAAKRLDGLLDEPRPGAPRKIGDDKIAEVVTTTLETLPSTATHWSTPSMARASGLAPSTVHRIWRAFSLQPHRSETFKLSTDPLFIEKVRDIVGLYLNPTIIGKCMPRHRAADFRRFLDMVEKNVPADLDVHVVMDNASSHKTKLIRDWFAKRPRWHMHFTPTSASWINQVERFFGMLTDEQIRRGAHRSVRDLEAAITAYIDARNAAPKPFRWVKSADDILAAVQRFCQRTIAIQDQSA